MSKSIIKVEAAELKNGKFSYTATYDDGTTELLRKAATRLYANAFMYEQIANWNTTGANQYFTYGMKPTPGNGIAKVFPITNI